MRFEACTELVEVSEDIDLAESVLYVKGRFVPLPTDAKAALKAWLDQIEGDRVFSIKPRAVRLVVKKPALSQSKGLPNTTPKPARFLGRSSPSPTPVPIVARSTS